MRTHRVPPRYALYSILASLLTLTLKFTAFALTSSVGLLSDATESLVNLTAGVIALTILIIAARPADEKHAYGHGKAEYFSSGAEGVLIIVAAGGIAWAAWQRFLAPVPLGNLGPGLLVAVLASIVNVVAARILLSAAKRFDSITLEADARHLLTDVWTSAGMIAGLCILFVVPSWLILDPIIAGIMAVNIVFTGVSLIRRSVAGLMDEALPEEQMHAIEEAIRSVLPDAEYHGLRARKAGAARFVDFHLLVPGGTTVQAAHDLTCDMEEAIRARLPRSQVTVHVEPLEDDASKDGDHVGGICSDGKKTAE
ncbi:cation diffusion facilitator family transporter [Desulfovibrio aminophilus]|nr:cation diffusion facilitator family transporter [Desulfovibrio aminophilus]MCM0753781.1 cation diffusion facilitator family transporter [Desulfovibrio aminophilus]